MKIHREFKVKGKVQGVFFRATTKSLAEDLFLKGFVKNQNDGSVYIEAEGEENSLLEFAEWLSEGPPFSSVEKVIKYEGGDVKGFKSFDIRH